MTERSWGPEDRPRRSPDAAFRNYEGERVVVVPSGAEINVLNDAGGTIFEMLDGQHTVKEIVEAIQEEYEVSRDKARKDLAEFLTALDAHRMLA